MIAASSGDDSTLGTLPLGWSLLIGLAIVAVLAVCVVRIVRDRRRSRRVLRDEWAEGPHEPAVRYYPIHRDDADG